MDPNQSNDGSQGGFPGGNNFPYMYGYQVPPWTHPQGFQVPQWSHPQGFHPFQSNVPMMHPTSNGAEVVLSPATMDDAAQENDVAEVEEVQMQGGRVQGRKKKPATRIKLPNFNPDEDVILVRSYAEIGDDPITNTGQKKERFWERITERYNLQRGTNVKRSLRSLGSRFEIISKDVSKFASYHAQVVRENPSGMTDADKTTHAAARFAGAEKRKFTYLHCWEIMKHLPKWQDAPGTTTAVGEGFGEDTINIGDENCNRNESADGKRPMGRDQAKAAKKKGTSAGSSSSLEYANRMQELSLQRNSIMQDEAERKNERFQQLASINEKHFGEMRSHNQALIALEQEKIRIMGEKHEMEKQKQEMERQKEEKQEDERILQIDLDTCTEAQRVYYKELQEEILEKIAFRRRKRQEPL